MPDQPTDLHVWDPNAKRLCACGKSPRAYGLPTDGAQWATWEIWHREHVTEEAATADKTRAALHIADTHRATAHPSIAEVALVDLADAVEHLTAQLAYATTELATATATLTRVKDVSKKDREGYWVADTTSEVLGPERRYGYWIDAEQLDAALTGTPQRT